MVTLDTQRLDKKAEIARLAEIHGAHNLRVFGSTARGDNRDDSDIDILAEFEDSRSLLDLIGFKLDLEELLGSTVDIVTPNSLRYMRDRVLAEAQVL